MNPSRLSCLSLLLALAVPPLQAEETFTRQEVDHAFGTDPGFTHYPGTAVDTDDAPNIVLGADDAPDTPLHYYEIADDTYMLFGNIAEVDEYNRGWNGNAGFVVTPEGVVVIDAVGTPKLGRRLISTIARVTDQPIKYLIVTHNHPDHAYGAITFKRLGGVTIIGHEGTRRYIDSGRIEHSVAYRKTFIPEDMADFAPVLPEVLIGGERFSRQRFAIGGKTFDVYNAGSHHSYGDLVVHQVEDGVVWISDLAFNGRVTFMEDGHSRIAIESQDWLLETFGDARLMVPGHGSAQTPDFPMVGRTRDYMQRLRDKMGAAVENDVGIRRAVDEGDFDDWKQVRMYGLNHRPNLNFVYREMEQELF